jgi:hypothetical protein
VREKPFYTSRKKKESCSAWVEETATRSWDKKKRKSVVGVAAAAIPPENEPASDGQLSQRSRNDVESQTPTNHGAGSTWYVLALSRFYFVQKFILISSSKLISLRVNDVLHLN